MDFLTLLVLSIIYTVFFAVAFNNLTQKSIFYLILFNYFFLNVKRSLKDL